jgi:hypothetical protein
MSPKSSKATLPIIAERRLFCRTSEAAWSAATATATAATIAGAIALLRFVNLEGTTIDVCTVQRLHGT